LATSVISAADSRMRNDAAHPSNVESTAVVESAVAGVILIGGIAFFRGVVMMGFDVVSGAMA
jgi:hypothetical protein